MLLLILLILLIFGLGGGGYYGYRQQYYSHRGFSLISVLLFVFLLTLLFGGARYSWYS